MLLSLHRKRCVFVCVWFCVTKRWIPHWITNLINLLHIWQKFKQTFHLVGIFVNLISFRRKFNWLEIEIDKTQCFIELVLQDEFIDGLYHFTSFWWKYVENLLSWFFPFKVFCLEWIAEIVFTLIGLCNVMNLSNQGKSIVFLDLVHVFTHKWTNNKICNFSCVFILNYISHFFTVYWILSPDLSSKLAFCIKITSKGDFQESIHIWNLIAFGLKWVFLLFSFRKTWDYRSKAEMTRKTKQNYWYCCECTTWFWSPSIIAQFNSKLHKKKCPGSEYIAFDRTNANKIP